MAELGQSYLPQDSHDRRKQKMKILGSKSTSTLFCEMKKIKSQNFGEGKCICAWIGALVG